MAELDTELLVAALALADGEPAALVLPLCDTLMVAEAAEDTEPLGLPLADEVRLELVLAVPRAL